MKSLRYLAILPLMAAASQAVTLDLQLGYGKPKAPLADGVAADNTSVVGIGVGTYVTENSHLGLNVSSRDIVTSNNVDVTARTAIVEYTYELNSAGGLKPFIGAGLGYASLKNTFKSSALATDVFAGLRFELNENVDFTLTARFHQLHGVDFDQAVGENNRQVNSFEALAGLRFNF
jgi:opacity protein-like surface antigen